MKNTGVITEIKGNKAKIKFIRESACGGNCESCSGCSTKPIEIYIENTLNAKLYDKVEVETETGKILFSAFLLYIFPLIALVLSYLLSVRYLGEILSSFVGVLCFILSFLLVKKYGNQFKIKTEMLRITEE